MLRPKIDLIPFFTEPGLGELRRHEYDGYRCNEYFSNVGYNHDSPEKCNKYYNSIGYYVYDGAHCKCFNTEFLILFLNLSPNRNPKPNPNLVPNIYLGLNASLNSDSNRLLNQTENLTGSKSEF